MNDIKEGIELLCKSWKQLPPNRIEQLPQSGSNRSYFRIYLNNQTYIATHNLNIEENETFFYFTQQFKSKQLPVPTVYCINEAKTTYIQEDLGSESLLDQLSNKGHSAEIFNLFRESLKSLANIQVTGNNSIDYEKCLTAKEFGKQAILSDLLYFKYYFLDTLQIPYDKQVMLNDFEALSTYLSVTEYKFFMFRDFQSRNIIVNQGKVFFIDYQGGMKGAPQYDVASLLWQAKAALSEDWKEQLLDFYITALEQQLNTTIDKPSFKSQYYGFVLIRLLQVLGAYGFRGLFERKAHFLSSIPFALKNLQYFLQHKRVGINTPELERVLKLITSESTIQKFISPKATSDTLLVVTINSFSYRKGIPADESENGGGFVFDVRSILNPGRFEDYKHLSGQDKPVQDFLEQQTKIQEYLNSVWNLVDIAVENYLERNFTSLWINFGCTGGQHRSVYAAEQTARHLRNKYNLKVLLNHTNQANWVKEKSNTSITTD